jgi:hypothetical protein
MCLTLALSAPAWSAAPDASLTPTAPAASEAGGQADHDRARVREFVTRANVKEKLEALGVSGFWAQSRVDSLTEEEVHALAERIDAMPAGGNLSQMDLVIVLLIAILVAILL